MSERVLIEFLLEQDYIVNTRKAARNFGLPTHTFGRMMSLLRKKGAVKLISQRRWEIDKDKLRGILAGKGCVECEKCTHRTKEGCVEG